MIIQIIKFLQKEAIKSPTGRDEEIFEKVQSERIRRSNIEITSEVKKRKSRKYSLKKPNYDKTHDE